MKKYLALLISVIIVLGMLAGCTGGTKDDSAGQSQGGTQSAAQDGEKKIKIAYICKLLNDEWFKEEDAGMKKAADELGIEYIGIDAQLNNERLMQAVETVIADGYDAVMMCITDAGLSSAVVKRFEEAGIPLLAIDDYITDENGNSITPYLGVPTYTMGYEVGLALAQMALDRDFFAEGNVVKVMALDMASTPTVHDTHVGHLDALKEKAGDKIDDSMIIIGDIGDGTFDETMKVATAIYNANPEVTHWIIPVPEDQSAFAAVKMLIENHFDFKNVVMCGNGAYSPSKEIFEMGGDIANSYISPKFYPRLEGEEAVKLLYDHLVNGTPLPMDTRVGEGYVSIDNWTEWDF